MSTPPKPRTNVGDVRAARTDPRHSSGGVVEVTRPTSNAALLGRGVGRVAERLRSGRGGVRATPASLPDVVLVRTDLRADREHLLAYQQLIGEEVRDVLPGGYLHTLAFGLHTAMLARRDFPLPALGMVHLANRVEVRRTAGVGESFEARLHAENLAPHRRGATVDLVAELTTDGEVVWRGVSTYLAKGVRLPDAGAPDAGSAPGAERPAERPAFVAPEPTGLWRLGADVGRRYAQVSGDHNPIHTSWVAARAFGFPRPIAHGMYTAARALADVGAAARGEAYRWEVEFATPVLLPSTVGVRVVPDDAGGWAIAVWSRSSKPHLTGTVRSLH